MHHQRREPGVLLLTNGNPAASSRSTTTPASSRRSRWPPLIRRVAGARRAAAADAVLQRDLRRPAARLPPADAVNPRAPRQAARPDHRRPEGRAAAVTTTTHAAGQEAAPRAIGAAQGGPVSDRSRAERAPRLDAGRTGLRGHARGHRLPDPAGGLLLAVQLPADRPRRTQSFIGLNNYGVILTDALWWQAVGVTVFITVVTVVVELVLGFALALVMDQGAHRAAARPPDGDPDPLRGHHRRLGVRLAVRLRHRLPASSTLVRLAAAVSARTPTGSAARWTSLLRHLPRRRSGRRRRSSRCCCSPGSPRCPSVLAGGRQGRRRDLVAAAVAGDAAEHEGGDHGRAAVPHPRRVPHLRQRLHHDQRGATSTETVSFLAYRQTISRVEIGLGSAVSVLLFLAVVLSPSASSRASRSTWPRRGGVLMSTPRRRPGGGSPASLILLYCLFPIAWIISLSLQGRRRTWPTAQFLPDAACRGELLAILTGGARTCSCRRCATPSASA